VAEARSAQPLRLLEALELPVDPRKPIDRLLWAEFFVNAAGAALESHAHRLIEQLPPLAERLEGCAFSYRPALGETLAWLRAPSAARDTPWFEWQGEHASEAELRVGFLPFALHTAARARSTLTRLLGDAAIPWEAYSAGTTRQEIDPGLLPRDLRSLILLLDRMLAQPWEEAGFWAEEEDASLWPGAVALTCARGYLAALALLPESERAQLPRFAREEMETSLAFAGIDAAELHKRVRSLARHAKTLAGKTKPAERHPLLAAAAAFLSSRAFQQAAETIEAPQTR